MNRFADIFLAFCLTIPQFAGGQTPDNARYEISMTIGVDGKVTTGCKLIKEGE